MSNRHRPVALAVAALFAATGCSTERDTSGLEPEPANTDPVVFLDGFTGGLDFQAFLGSHLTALSIDTTERYAGDASLKFTVPHGQWAGGAFPTSRARDLSGYDALTFWAKASQPITLDVVGLGNDNSGLSKYEASWSDVPLTTLWTKYAVPIPHPERLRGEDGLFFLADGEPSATGEYSIWFDNVRFERLGTITNPRPRMTSDTVEGFENLALEIEGTRTTFAVAGTDRLIEHMPGYFTFFSSDESVATVSRDGRIQGRSAGTALITAKLGEVAVAGSLAVNIRAADPTGPAPTPPHAAGNVISIFSNAYPDIPGTVWSTSWDNARIFDLQIGGDDVKVIEFDEVPGAGQPYAAIDFSATLINAEAAGMTHFHMDVWVPGGFWTKIKLVDFGSDGIYTSGDVPNVTPCDPGAPEGDISQHEAQLIIGNPSDPDDWTAWAQIDIPLSDFREPDIHGDCLRSTAHLAQIIMTIANGLQFAYVDNIYFYK